MVKQIDFNKIALPPILYKYRNWNDIYNKRYLTKNEVFFATPSSFTDKKDCKLPIRFDLMTDTDIYNFALNVSKSTNLNFNNQEHKNFAEAIVKSGKLKDKKYLTEIENIFFEKFDDLNGILCLTPFSDSIQMWQDYAKEHTGFCVGFHIRYLHNLAELIGQGGKVIYYETLPDVFPHYTDEEKMFLQIFSKLDIYEFEQEYRLTTFNHKDRQVQIPIEAFAEIYLGAKMPIEYKNEIIEICTRNFPNIKIFQANLNGEQLNFSIITPNIQNDI